MAPLVSGGVRGRRRGQCGDPERSPPECSGGSGRTADDCRDVLVAGREGSVTGQRRGGGGQPPGFCLVSWAATGGHQSGGQQSHVL